MRHFIRNPGVHFIDLFTLGHLAFGFFGWIIAFFVLERLGLYEIDSRYVSLLFTTFFSILWETFENCTRAGFALRPIKHKDTLRNSLGDIIFGIIGSLIAFFIL